MVKFKKNNVLGVITGIIIGAGLGIGLAYIESSTVGYDNSKSRVEAENVQDALDDVYDRVTKLYFHDGDIIYYNPITNTACKSTDYKDANSTTEYIGAANTDTQNGCLRWFAYGDSDGANKVKLLLDHNTTARVQWYNTSTNGNVLLKNSTYIQTELGKLTTAGWSPALDVTLIDANDIAKITNNSSWTSSGSYFYFETNTTSGGSSYNQSTTPYSVSEYWWLYDRTYNCEKYGCKVQDNNTYTTVTNTSSTGAPYGYWTSTPYGTPGSGSNVWRVDYYGLLGSISANKGIYGVRPVITVSKSDL